jgi:transglutaminase-like putative cysteine protease
MQFQMQYHEIEPYLESSDIIDFNEPNIKNLTHKIKASSENNLAFIKNAYEYVRDEISHSADIDSQKLTCKASEVLREKEGVCFAKSHLLAAILRCGSIPAGLCYQQLILEDETAPFLVYHGLNAVYIEECNKWIRLDPRGNKAGVDAQFSLEEEKLAYPIRSEKGERDVPILFAKPDRNIVKALTENKTREELWDNLPTTLWEKEQKHS